MHSKRIFITGSVLTLLVIGILVLATPANAVTLPTLSLDIHAGDMLEMNVDTHLQGGNYSWILTKDHRFLTAQRTMFFQTRQSLPGTYLLDVNVQNDMQTEYYAFSINVSPSETSSPMPRIGGGGPLTAVLTTEPTATNGVVHLPVEGGMLKLDPSLSQGDLTNYMIDLNSMVDSDNDGNPVNDPDTSGTYSERNGTPVYVYMLPGSRGRKVTLTVKNGAGVSSWTQIEVAFDARPDGNASKTISGQNGAFNATIDGQQASFTITDSQITQQDLPLLYEWDFGDKTKSFLEHPVHQYALPGQYTTTFTARDIRTGQVRATDTAAIIVDAGSAQASSVSASSDQSSVSSRAASIGTSNGLGSNWLAIIQVVGIILILLSIALGLYFLLHWLKRLTTVSLQKKIETMEGKIFADGKPQSGDVLDAAAVPLQIRKDDKPEQSLSEREMDRRDFQGPNRDAVSPIIDAGPVPQWLQNAETRADTAPPLIAQAQEVVPQPQPAVDPGTVPDWLKTPAPPENAEQTTNVMVANPLPPSVPSSMESPSISQTDIDQPTLVSEAQEQEKNPVDTPAPNIVPEPETDRAPAPSEAASEKTENVPEPAQENLTTEAITPAATVQPLGDMNTETEDEQLPDWMRDGGMEAIPTAETSTAATTDMQTKQSESIAALPTAPEKSVEKPATNIPPVPQTVLEVSTPSTKASLPTKKPAASTLTPSQKRRLRRKRSKELQHHIAEIHNHTAEAKPASPVNMSQALPSISTDPAPTTPILQLTNTPSVVLPEPLNDSTPATPTAVSPKPQEAPDHSEPTIAIIRVDNIHSEK